MSGENPLSGREREILQLVAEGLTNREIAQRLSISPNTVKVHLSNIFEKAGVASRTEATLYAIEHRIVEVPGGETVQPASKETLWTYISDHPWVGLISVLLIVTMFSTILITIFNSSQSEEIDPATLNRWQELTPMPEARVGLTAVAYDNQIYAIAGEGKEGVSGSVFRYDIAEDSWKRLLDKPTPVTDVGGVLIGEEIYIPGGLGADGSPVDVLEIYDPRHNTWSTGAPLPEPLSAYAIADFEGKLYLFGGWDGKNAVGDVWVYDPAEDVWLDRGTLGINLMGSIAVPLTDNVVLLGGQNESGDFTDIISYYPSRYESNEELWEFFGELPVNAINLSAATLNDFIYLFSVNAPTSSSGDQAGVFVFYTDSEWKDLNIEMEFDTYQESVLVAIGPQLFFFLPSVDFKTTDLVRYQALYYEIYVPIIN